MSTLQYGFCFFQDCIWFGCTSKRSASSASVRSPRTAARATFALNEGLWVLRVRLDMGLVGLIVSEQGRNTTP